MTQVDEKKMVKARKDFYDNAVSQHETMVKRLKFVSKCPSHRVLKFRLKRIVHQKNLSFKSHIFERCGIARGLYSSLLAPQSGAHTITPHRDFHPNSTKKGSRER